jgi:hypothetical protein
VQGIGLLKYLKSLSLVTLLAAATLSSQAASTTYNLANASSSAGTLTGTVDIDSATGLITSANITFNDIAAGGPLFTNVGSTAAYNGISQAFVSGASNGPLNYGGQLALYFDTSNIGLGNLPICVAAGPCGLYGSPGSYAQVYVSNANGGPFYLTSGELDLQRPAVDPAPAAEPPSLILLGTGILFAALSLARFSRAAEESADA